jgi:heat shock protein HtpX
MIKRIFLFLLTNILVIVLISVTLTVLRILWIDVWWYFNWVNYLDILIYAWVVWFSWALISLFLSKSIVKWTHDIVFIDDSNLSNFSQKEILVYETVRDLANREWIRMPEVWIYKSPEPNAFATWPTKNSALVAVSTWLLENMSNDEIVWVVGHEVSHITNWDMVTMTLLQWVINTFVIFLSRIVASLLDKVFSEDSWPGWVYYIVSIVLEILFSILASIVVMAFSRYREYRADEWSARFVWKDKMIKALKKLKSLEDMILTDSNDALATMKIWSEKRSWLFALFSSHPDLDDRIRNLEEKNF